MKRLIISLVLLSAGLALARPFIVQYHLAGKSAKEPQTVTIDAKTEGLAERSFHKMFPTATLDSIKEKR